jgi:uncharacterized protein with von Willebrand factor type A (vWA) domain
MSSTPSTGPLADNLIHFARYLRTRGLPVTSDSAADLLRAALTVGLENPDDAFHALKAVSITRPDHQPIFHEAWELFFGSGRFPRTPKLDTIEFQTWRRNPTLRVIAPTSTQGSDEEVAEPKELTEQMGGSYAERLAGRDFAELTEEEQEEIRRILARMIWHPADTVSRRWEPTRSRVRPDLRRTLRNLVGSKADLLPLAYSAPRPRRRPLLVLADVSGSMERYVEMFLYFIHAARGRLGRLEAFVFATHLTRITRQVRHRDPRVALSQIADAVNDWSGGTRIGESLAAFNRDWNRRVVRGGPIALIISDGWDRGDPDLLRSQMGVLNRSVHRVIWLNPLAGRPGFAPETRGMQAALPFVDDFLPAANLRDLRDVIRTLETVPGHRRPRPLNPTV